VTTSPDRRHDGRPVEPGEPALPTTNPAAIAYVVVRIVDLIKDVTRSTPQLVRSIILLWSMIVPIVVIMWASRHLGIHIDSNAWYAQWPSWIIQGGLGTLAITAKVLAKVLQRRWHRRKARRRRQARGRPPPSVRTAAGRPGPAPPGDGA
jgi:hypothetical protein